MRRINYGNEKLGGPKKISQFYGQVKIGVKIFYLTHKRIFSNPNSNEVFNFLGNFSWNTKVSKYNRGVGWLWSADANVTSSNPALHRLSEKPLSRAGYIPETFGTGSPRLLPSLFAVILELSFEKFANFFVGQVALMEASVTDFNKPSSFHSIPDSIGHL